VDCALTLPVAAMRRVVRTLAELIFFMMILFERQRHWLQFVYDRMRWKRDEKEAGINFYIGADSRETTR
jgi:hypothetical protein